MTDKITKTYEVIVGNIGRVYRGEDKNEAQTLYQHYLTQSEAQHGRAAGEDVSLFENGEPIAEFTGALNRNDD